jgi:hypothetical protein
MRLPKALGLVSALALAAAAGGGALADDRDDQARTAYCLIRRCSQTWMPLPH